MSPEERKREERAEDREMRYLAILIAVTIAVLWVVTLAMSPSASVR